MRKSLLILLIAALCIPCHAGQAKDPLPRRGFFGAQLQALSPDRREELKVKGGVTIMSIVPGATAEGGKLQAGDVLLKLDDQVIATPGDIGAFVYKTPPGQKFSATILREGKEQVVALTMIARPKEQGDNYEVIYDHVVSHGHRLRTLVTRSKAQGKLPVLFLIQGIGYSTIEAPLNGPGGYSRILKAFNDKGYVTVRVEKPGLGDSEGGPANTVDYERDLDAFRQALKAVKAYDFVDPDNIFIFGHSMGGCHGPIIASEIPVKGLAVYGTVARTWQEYTIENSRRQSLLAGQSPAEVDQEARLLIAANHLLFNEGLDPAEAKKKYPQHAAAIDAFSPDGKTMSGMPMAFWKQVFAYNFADYWMKVNTNVLSLFGENEFIASQIDHPFIADIVNKVKPGSAKYVEVKESDHGFFKTTSMRDSFVKWTQPGKEVNPVVIDHLIEWAEAIRQKS